MTHPHAGASEVEALAAREDQGNGAHDPASAGTPYARKMGGTAPCPLRPLCGAHRIHAGHPGGGLPQGGIGPPGGQQVPDAQTTLPVVYESLRKRGFTVIPWQERHVRSLLNQLADEEVTPCKLRQVWNTLKWFSKTFGLLKIDELHRLKSKKSLLEEALTDTVTRPQRKAVVPSKEVIWALEEGAGYDRLGATGPGTQEAPRKSRHEVLDAFILGFARFQVGCSTRFHDLQPRTLSTPATLWS